uniref:Uncharacterized protein n=1 Tax=Aegilops tauschii subsp. strangulata TaxID=200361 RepID=A0A453S536_AEGTS
RWGSPSAPTTAAGSRGSSTCAGSTSPRTSTRGTLTPSPTSPAAGSTWLPESGIHGYELRWMLRDSGLLRAQASWATFAGAYHVGYFAAMMSGEKLPDDVDDFMEMVRQLLGPAVYDVKRLARQHDQRCVGALGHIVKQLGVVQPNEPKPTPAGTGSTLALLAFETLKEKLGANAEKYRGQLCGLQAV